MWPFPHPQALCSLNPELSGHREHILFLSWSPGSTQEWTGPSTLGVEYLWKSRNAYCVLSRWISEVNPLAWVLLTAGVWLLDGLRKSSQWWEEEMSCISNAISISRDAMILFFSVRTLHIVCLAPSEKRMEDLWVFLHKPPSYADIYLMFHVLVLIDSTKGVIMSGAPCSQLVFEPLYKKISRTFCFSHHGKPQKVPSWRWESSATKPISALVWGLPIPYNYEDEDTSILCVD